MGSIDAYCGYILAGDRFRSNDSAADFPREQFLNDLENDLLEMSVHDRYTADEIHSGRVLLLVLKKTFGSTKIWNGSKPDKQLTQYYQDTMRMLDRQIKTECFDADEAMTIISNLMLIVCNIANGKNRKNKKKDGFVHLLPMKTDHAAVYRYLNKIYGVEKKKRFSERARKLKPYGRLATITVTLGSIFGAFYFAWLVWKGQNDVVVTQVRPESTDLFGGIANWWNYDLWAKPLPEVVTDGQLKVDMATNRTWLMAFAAVALLMILAWVIRMALRPVLRRHKNRVKHQAADVCDWYEFCYLQKVLMATDVRLKELE